MLDEDDEVWVIGSDLTFAVSCVGDFREWRCVCVASWAELCGCEELDAGRCWASRASRVGESVAERGCDASGSAGAEASPTSVMAERLGVQVEFWDDLAQFDRRQPETRRKWWGQQSACCALPQQAPRLPQVVSHIRQRIDMTFVCKECEKCRVRCEATGGRMGRRQVRS